MKIMEGKRMNRLAGMILAIFVFIAMMPFGTLTVNAEAYKGKIIGDYTYDIYNDGTSSNPYGSVHMEKYNGSATQIILPSQVTYEGMTFNAWDSKNNTQGNGAFAIGEAAFSGNTKITKIAIPQGYMAINTGEFKGCTSLTEVAIGDTVNYLEEGVFTDCPAKTYYFKGEDVLQSAVQKSGIGTDASGNPISGVTVWTKKDSNVDKAIQALNNTRPADKKINLKYDNDPYSKNTVRPDSGGGSTPPANNGSAAAVEKKILTNNGEKDIKGSTFRLLQARAKKVAKTSVTIGWSKPKGAKSYVIYGNTCNAGKKKYKFVKLTTTKRTRTLSRRSSRTRSRKAHIINSSSLRLMPMAMS